MSHCPSPPPPHIRAGPLKQCPPTLPPGPHYLRGFLIIHPQCTRSFITISASTAVTISQFDCYIYPPTLTKTYTCQYAHTQECIEYVDLSGRGCVLRDAHSHYNTPPYSELKLVSVLAMAEVNACIVKLQNISCSRHGGFYHAYTQAHAGISSKL